MGHVKASKYLEHYNYTIIVKCYILHATEKQ